MKKAISSFLVVLIGLLIPTFLFDNDVAAFSEQDILWPVSDSYQISTLYYYYNDGSPSRHKGWTYKRSAIDILASFNSQILAVASGKVIDQYGFNMGKTTTQGGTCRYVLILSDEGSYIAGYYHLSQVNVKVGDHVDQGQVIGYAGQTGNSTGVHLHFEWSGNDPWQTVFRHKYWDRLRYESSVINANRMMASSNEDASEANAFFNRYGITIEHNYADRAPTDWHGAPLIYADLGKQFYAVIRNTAKKKPISLNTSTNKITIETEKKVAYQKWRFTRQSDGAYLIESCANGKVLEMTNGEREQGTQLTAHDDWWGATDPDKKARFLQWYLIPQGKGYIFLSKHHSSAQWVMDMKDSNAHDGTVVQIYKRNSSFVADETWSVDKSDGVQLKATKLSVTAGTETTKTKFTWNSVYGATHFNVRIWKDKVDNSVSSYHSGWKVSSGYSVQLPPGNYEAYVDACDNYKCLRSNQVKFTVKGKADLNTPVNLGADFYGVILSYKIWKPIGNDFETDHFIRLQTGEHENNSAHQLWRFQRQSDGSYAIRSVQDAYCLEYHDGIAERYENHPVSAHNVWWNGACQKWWIYQSINGGYVLKSCHYDSEGWYMTLKGNNSADGTPITMCSYTGNDNQIWGIYTQSEVQLKAPTVSVAEGTSSTPTQFTWEHVFGAKEFKVNVWKNGYVEGRDPDFTDTVTSTSSSIQLPAGTYEASVTASNYWKSYTSQKVSFTVSSETYQVDYDFNGGIGRPLTQTKYYGTALALNAVAPDRTGYEFEGWNSKADGTGTNYNLGGTYTANSSVTLYANWKICDHTWNSGVVSTAAACMFTGIKTYTCTICGETKNETIAPTGKHIDSNTDGYCDVCSSVMLKITAQPKSLTQATGTMAKFTVAATGSGTLSYQWKVSTDGTHWTNSKMTGYNTATLQVPVKADKNGYKFLCVVTDANGSVTSSAATLTVTKSTAKITTQPKSLTQTVGTTVKFTVAATGSGTLSYQWKVSTDGTHWTNSKMTGYNTKTLQVPVKADKNGYKFICVVTDANGSVTSSTATLTVIKSTAKITAQPKSLTQTVGTTAKFTVTATGSGTLSYQWKVSTDGIHWTNSKMTGYNTATLQVPVKADKNGYKFLCVVTDANGSVTSSSATLMVA